MRGVVFLPLPRKGRGRNENELGAALLRSHGMTNKIIIIGASGGIGSALAKQLSDKGHSLHLVGRDAARVEAVASGLGAAFAVADVGDRAALDAAVKAAGAAVGGLAYCVGSINLKPVGRITDEDVERDFRLNALGAFRAVQAALPG